MALILGTKIAEHDGCFALVRDGEPLFVHEEERFNRIKHGLSCAAAGLWEGLSDFGVDLDALDLVTNYIDETLVGGRHKLYRDFYAGGDRAEADRRYDRVAWQMPLYRRLLIGLGVPEHKIVDVRHHLAHCAGVFYPSPFHEAAILSIDGGGEAETVVLAHGADERIDVLESLPHPHSLGHFYLAATRWLGWDYGEEGKTMALAAYGQPRFYKLLCDQVIDIEPRGNFRFKLPLSADAAIAEALGPGRGAGEITQRHKDVAASAQRITSEIMIRLAGTLRRETGSRNLVVTGGVGLNSVANGEIMNSGLYDHLLAYPQANDTGTALGGALWAEYNLVGRKRRKWWVMEHAYLGREIDAENAPAVAQRYGLEFRRVRNPAETAARLIADGKIVG